MGGDVQSKVLEWLETTGFPLEMAAAEAFRQVGFENRQSITYVDPETKTGREIDVVANRYDWIGVKDINFVIECKSSKNPWIVLTSAEGFGYLNIIHAFAVMSDNARAELTKDGWKETKTFPFLDTKNRSGGYGFRQAFSRNDTAFEASMNVLKACVSLTGQKRTPIPYLSIAFPVIVIDTPLFECQLDDDGQLSLKEVESARYLFSAHIPDLQMTCITVVTKKYLPEYADWAKRVADALDEDLEAESQRILKSL